MTNNKRATLIGVCLAMSLVPMNFAATLPDQAVREIIERAVDGFWGNAKLSDGSIVQPENEDERNSPIIPDAHARRVVQDAILAGVAMWCDVEWEEYYLTYMQRERRGSWTEKQIAFIGVLFGTSQGSVQKTMKNECDLETRDKVIETIRKNTKILNDSLAEE